MSIAAATVETPTEFDLRMRQVDAQLAEYERGVAEYAAFMEAWRSRNTPAGRRLQRFTEAAGTPAGYGNAPGMGQ